MIILTCDSVLHEAEQIQTIAFDLFKNSQNRDLIRFIEIVIGNFPEFSAARFFSIDRSTILKILDATITFLIVVIQFQINVGHEGQKASIDNSTKNYFEKN